jgi:hypothetical protein
MTLRQKWKEHLKHNNMTYWQHLKFAVGQAGEKLVHRLDKNFTEHKNNVTNK